MKITKTTRQALLVLAGFASILLIFGLATSISLASMSSVNQRLDKLVKETNAKSRLMTQMRDTIRERMVNIFTVIYLEDPFQAEEQWEDISRYAGEFIKAREQLNQFELTPAQLQQLEKQKALLKEGQDIIEQVMALVRAGKNYQASQLVLQTREVNDRVVREISAMRDYQEQLAQQAVLDASADYEATRGQVIVLETLAMGLCLGIAWLVVHRITNQEKALADALAALKGANELLEFRVQERTAELMSAHAEALEASRTKSRFLANMSHELRTPLNAIIGYCEILKDECEDAGSEEMREDLNKIHASGKHLLELINDILDISKIEAGKAQIHAETFDLRGLVQEVIQTMQPMVKQKQNELIVAHAPGLDSMYADPMRVRQILCNLLSNANKFTERGRLGLDIEAAGDAGAPWVVFRVSDTGIGISPENLAKLFKPFTQVDPSATRKYGGTGLGLVISLRFCEMMGGSIAADSEPGKGSTFTVRLPLHVTIAQETQRPATETATQAG